MKKKWRWRRDENQQQRQEERWNEKQDEHDENGEDGDDDGGNVKAVNDENCVKMKKLLKSPFLWLLHATYHQMIRRCLQ